MARLNEFDRIAPLYDLIARAVFGASIRNAQRQYLPRINRGARILVLGGGTGWILADIDFAAPNCEVWYLEASSKMLDRAKSYAERSSGKVHFVHGTEANIPNGIFFDVIIANFYFDLFSPAALPGLVKSLTTRLANNGAVLVSDFIHTERRWQRWLLKIMYTFFSLTCGIDNRRLPDWRGTLQGNGLIEMEATTFFNGFIVSAVYCFTNGEEVGSRTRLAT